MAGQTDKSAQRHGLNDQRKQSPRRRMKYEREKTKTGTEEMSQTEERGAGASAALSGVSERSREWVKRRSQDGEEASRFDKGGGSLKKKRGENKEEEEELRWWVRRYLCGRAEKPSPEEAADYDGDCGGAVMGWDGLGWVTQERTSSVSKWRCGRSGRVHTRRKTPSLWAQLQLNSTELTQATQLNWVSVAATQPEPEPEPTAAVVLLRREDGPMSSLF
ncbi:hypothetical protein MRS44_001555 [Fusarium solani]|uniref:uncharacterized protein n=1 Tax=Fusarium solani TaxID=169388 RepID=UPI0032C471A1|nr:hypothetical protein MRS44_001555 [Fusarium solani]